MKLTLLFHRIRYSLLISNCLLDVIQYKKGKFQNTLRNFINLDCSSNLCK